MRATTRRLRAVLGATVASLAVAVGTTSAGDRDPAAAGFAGAAACAPCHASEVASWRTSNHALTTVEARGAERPQEALAGRRVVHPPGASTFRAQGDGMVVETVGDGGVPASFAGTHVVGRRRIKMYVATLADGRRQVLPAMKDEASGAWFDYSHLIFGVPGARPDEPPVLGADHPSFWTGPVRSFDARCTRCHTSGREVAVGAAGTRPQARSRALGVDCEACHGPCAPHVAARTAAAGAALPAGADPVLRWWDLAPARALDACLACHLEAEPMGAPLLPGGAALDVLDPTLLDDPERFDLDGRPMELVYEGLSFLLSRCAGGGALSCTDCHASHGARQVALLSAPLWYEERCTRCHQAVAAAGVAHTHHAAGGEGARCVACHMPKLLVERGHGVVTDHTIGIPRVAAAPTPAQARDACTGCHEGGRGFPAGAPPLARPALASASARWWPQAAKRPAWHATLSAARAAKDAAATPALADLVLDTRAPVIVRATAARLLRGRPGLDPTALLDAARDDDGWIRRQAYFALAPVRGPEIDAALLAGLADASAPVRIHAARASVDGFERVTANPALLRAALPVLVEDVASAPDDDQRWFRLGAARQLAGDLAGAIEAFERQVALDPFATAVRDHLPALRAKLAKPAR